MSNKQTGSELQGGAIYADLKHVNKFLTEGRTLDSLPRIHRDMGVAMGRIPEDQRRGAIDFGACHGMLSVRAKLMGWTHVLGLERDQPSIDAFNQLVAPVVPGVELEQASLDVRSDAFAATAIGWGALGYTTWLARRVLSELFATTYNARVRGEEAEAIWKPAGYAYGKAAHDAGVQYIVLQGRAYGPYKDRATHPIYNTDREIYALGPRWRETFRFKDAALMERV